MFHIHVFFMHAIVYSSLDACVCVWGGEGGGGGSWATAALFINTSVGLTVHNRGEKEPWDSLGQRPHKKSLLIYFPPNWKVHAHTWLNHHASTGDGPPLHADETWSQFCRAGPSQTWLRKQCHAAYTDLNGFYRCGPTDSPSYAWSLLLPNIRHIDLIRLINLYQCL